MIRRVRIVEVMSPPTMGAAIRFITSEPVPWLHMMGMSPAMMATTVIILGRTRRAAPSSIDSQRCLRLKFSPYVALKLLYEISLKPDDFLVYNQILANLYLYPRHSYRYLSDPQYLP